MEEQTLVNLLKADLVFAAENPIILAGPSAAGERDLRACNVVMTGRGRAKGDRS
jgi:hypothetical protein